MLSKQLVTIFPFFHLLKNTVFKEIMTQNEKQSLTGDEEIIKELVSCILCDA